MTFEDHSGDEEFRWLSKGVPTMLLTGLAQIPGLDVVSNQRLHEILKKLGQEEFETIDKSLVSEVARRSGAGAVVMGSIFKSGLEIRIDVQIEDVESGRILSAHSARGSDVFPMVDELTGGIRTSLQLGGEPEVRPIAEVMTPSLEAFRLYSEGLEARRNQRFTDARKLFEGAVMVDPSFAMAYFQLWRIANMLLEPALSEQYIQKVLEHLDRLPERQRLLVQATIAGEAEGNPEKAVELLESLVTLYPDEEDGYLMLVLILNQQLQQSQKALAALELGVKAIPSSGQLHSMYGYGLLRAGLYPEAFREFETYVQLHPDEPNSYDCLGEFYLVTGQPETALEWYTRALEVDPSFGQSHGGRAWAYAMMGNWDETFSEFDQFKDWAVRLGAPLLGFHFSDAFAHSRLGRHRVAKGHLQKGIELAQLHKEAEFEANLELLSSLLAIERNDYSRALERVSRAREIIAGAPAHQQRGGYVLAHLMAGIAEVRRANLKAARDHLASQKELFDRNNLKENWWHHALEGEIALAVGDLATAESAFSAGEPELKMWFDAMGGPDNLFANGLPFRDGLARVKKARGDLAGAIEIYRKLNTPDINNKWTALLEPRYVLEVARLLDEMGDKEGARAEYERFLELWKDADPELPELDEARRYLAK
jgi:tetratricopeptide (TPR) repeat protein/TolB-like protein